MLFDDDNAPPGCFEFLAQVSSADYEVDASHTCGVEYVRDGAACRLTCQSASECQEKYETCDPTRHVCVGARRRE